ncbi:MAG: hypothetical protein A2X86_12825 [Bdellovibrionales bacterium GWA2_49_15]|nr:MAG: hypothetical protein A2X86_12825 [Bdellovibrionales bacterium GWA2_49_15]HAZ14737.1 hypothetical protein [Bdellovibrionales bacterium]
MKDEILINYLRDTVEDLLDTIEKTKEECDSNNSDKITEGHFIGLVHVLHVFYLQAKAFNLDPLDLGFKFDPEEYFYQRKDS